jgi:hypothetical protein
MALGISELKDLATAVAQTANSIDGIFADGKVDLRDLGNLPSVLAGLRGFAEVNFSEVLPQAVDLTIPEAHELSAHFKAVFNLREDNIEVVVEQGLDLVVRGVEAVMEIISIAKTIKDALTPKVA